MAYRDHDSSAPDPHPASDDRGGTVGPSQSWLFWTAMFLIVSGGLYLLQTVLLPFVAGAAIAYFLDPVADWLERHGFSRVMATVLITSLFLVVIIGILLLLLPALQAEIIEFINRIPVYAQAISERLKPVLMHVATILPESQVQQLTDGASGMVGNAFGWVFGVLRRLLSGGFALVNMLSLLVISPVVAFYLLRDWDKMVAHIADLLPRRHAQTIQSLAQEADIVVAGFVRGQAIVCVVLGTFYAIGLSLVGLDLGLVVGLGAGLISFIPYVGTILGFLVSIGLAFAQFSETTLIALTAGIFILGQFLEGNFLSPWLVGNRVGLHPVWMIFSLLAGGTLFGFVGILLAIPVAAVLGVLVRFFLGRYQNSVLYRGSSSR